jgi:Fe-S-cluster containining protein
MGSNSIHLTSQQAVEAVCRDLRQYEPQVLLLCEILRVLGGPEATVKRDAAGEGVWLSSVGHPYPHWFNNADLPEHVCKLLDRAAHDPDKLVAICSRVFQTRVQMVPDHQGGHTEFEIDTGMEGFACRQCGQCCIDLDYRNELTAEDVDRWKKAGRDDILKWIGTARHPDGRGSYQIWVIPGTNRFAESCPFLEFQSTCNRWTCRIHDIKPAICRNYPVSRKHGLMTGCRGFRN